jgi:exodeoxyribonuclease V alpha subunit
MISQETIILNKLASLKQSKFRSIFKLTQKDRDYIATKGLETIKEHAFQFVNSRVASDFPKNDGKQTPMRGHAVFIAQHATATCCRGCILKWHRIEKGRVLDEKELQYIVALIMGWIGGQLDEVS